MIDDLHRIQAFEDALSVGDAVTMYWTNSYNYYKAQGKVSKINSASVRVELVTAPGEYVIGQDMLSPKTNNQRWSWNNYVGPPESEEGTSMVSSLS